VDSMLRSETHGISLTAEVRDGWVLLAITQPHGCPRMTVRLRPTDALTMGSRLIELAFLQGVVSDVASH
jgi:hypothetical protein